MLVEKRKRKVFKIQNTICFHPCLSVIVLHRSKSTDCTRTYYICCRCNRRPKVRFEQGWHRLEKYLNLEGFLEKSLKIKYDLKSTRKSLKGLEKSLNSSTFAGLKVLIDI